MHLYKTSAIPPGTRPPARNRGQAVEYFSTCGVEPLTYHLRMPATAKKRPASRPQTQDPAALVLRQFRIVFNAVKTHFQQVEKRAGVGGAHVWALSVVRDKPGIGVSELARAMDIHQSTASNLVKSLVERELLKAEKNGDDRRTVQLRLLPQGAKVLRKAPAPLSGVLPQALARLDEAALKRMTKDLALLIAELQPEDDGAAQRPLAEL
jgi:DNA-binding MarR family transcriptional regulator